LSTIFGITGGCHLDNLSITPSPKLSRPSNSPSSFRAYREETAAGRDQGIIKSGMTEATSGEMAAIDDETFSCLRSMNMLLQLCRMPACDVVSSASGLAGD
jgi:hypothetical protein